jgi:hypothetical protein
MTVNSTSSATSAAAAGTSYVPPTFRNRQIPIAKKTALKKEFAEAFNPSAFPALGETMTNTKSRGTPISFSSAAAKKVIVPKIEKVAEVVPGWVHIRRHQGIIQYKYGAPISNAAAQAHDDVILGAILFKYQIAREQYERDRDVERLGDLSEFYGEPTLAEIYANDSIAIQEMEENNGYGHSDYSGDD